MCTAVVREKQMLFSPMRVRTHLRRMEASHSHSLSDAPADAVLIARLPPSQVGGQSQAEGKCSPDRGQDPSCGCPRDGSQVVSIRVG